jgi:hypothetical protein
VADKTPARPKNVVMVDAENPLVEVRGEFFWREDHEGILAAAREEAYRNGYADGWTQASQREPVTRVVLRRRPSFLARIIKRGVVGIIILALVAAVVLTAIQGALSRG